MILVFGPAGSGKSLQSQLLAAAKNWRWLSMGQLLRDTKDPEIYKVLQAGELVSPEITNTLITETIQRMIKQGASNVIIDGYPRQMKQAQWLIESGLPIDLAININVQREELIKRLQLRGRADDENPDSINERHKIYEQNFYSIRQFLESKGVKFADVDGNASIPEVHQRILGAVNANR